MEWTNARQLAEVARAERGRLQKVAEANADNLRPATDGLLLGRIRMAKRSSTAIGRLGVAGRRVDPLTSNRYVTWIENACLRKMMTSFGMNRRRFFFNGKVKSKLIVLIRTSGQRNASGNSLAAFALQKLVACPLTKHTSVTRQRLFASGDRSSNPEAYSWALCAEISISNTRSGDCRRDAIRASQDSRTFLGKNTSNRVLALGGETTTAEG